MSRAVSIAIAAALLVSGSGRASEPTPAARNPLIFASPIQAGCRTYNARTCQIVVEPFTINIAAGRAIAQFQLRVDSAVVYDWRPDQSNPPAGPKYAPSSVALGFGVTCGRTHVVSLVGRDTGDSSLFTLGSAGPVTCPAPLLSLTFYTLTPCRVIDTRRSAGADAGAPALAPGETRTVATAGKCGIPPTAAGISANVTVTGPAGAGNLVLYAADVGLPNANTLSFSAGQTRACQDLVGLAVDASGFKVTNASAGSAHLVLDVNGYFE